MAAAIGVAIGFFVLQMVSPGFFESSPDVEQPYDITIYDEALL